MSKKSLFLFVLLLFLSSVFAESEIGPFSRTWINDSFRYGLPGLININDGSHINKSYLPVNEELIVIDLPTYCIQYAGVVYDNLTIASGTRVFLGKYSDYKLPPDGSDGLYPYVKAVNSEIQPLPNESRIAVAWSHFDENKDDPFTVVEIGPFVVTGQSDYLICQVVFYWDGEIQIQYWNKSRNLDLYNYKEKVQYLNEKNYLNLPYVYTGYTRQELSTNNAKTLLFSTGGVAIYAQNESNHIREGWNVKNFDGYDPSFSAVLLDLNIDFGSINWSGAVFSNVNSREYPVVGSFQRMDVDATSLTNGNTQVYFWYFEEDYTFPYATTSAGYPYLVGSEFHLNEVSAESGVAPECVQDYSGSPARIYPCAYARSWKNYRGGSSVDLIKVPAVKIQKNGDGTDTKIKISRIAFVPNQPMSIQFKAPSIHKIEYEGDVGYLDVGGSKAPVTLIKNSDVHAAIHVTPGYLISKISVNGQLAFDETDPLVQQPAFEVDYRVNQNLAYLDFKLVGNVKIAVTYRLCSDKIIEQYDPSLTNIEPSYEKKVVFNDANPLKKDSALESYFVKDGFGQVVQSQIQLNANAFEVSAVYSDEMGNSLYAPMPYIAEKSSYSFEEMHCLQCVRKSAAYYNGETNLSKERINSYGYPYSEINHHYGENMALVETKAGVGQASFDLGKNFAKMWNIPVKTSASSEFFTIDQLKNRSANNDLNAVGSFLDNEYWYRIKEINENDLKDDVAATYPYELNVNLSFEGTFTQSISDAAGNLIATWIIHDGDILVTRNEYYGYDDSDVKKTSLLKRSYIEGHESFQTTYFYDDIGRLISTNSPDRGRSEIRYDSKNRIRFTRDEKQIRKGMEYFNVLVYDDNDNVVLSGSVKGSCGGCSFDNPDGSLPLTYITPIRESVYGIPSISDLQNKAKNVDPNIIANIVNSIEGVSIRDIGASISYNDEGSVNTIKLSSYDRLGRRKKLWIINNVEKEAPIMELAYTYNSLGAIDTSTISNWNSKKNQWDVVSKNSRDYDRFGRLKKVYEYDANGNPMLMAMYSRNTIGTVVHSKFYDKGDVSDTNKNIVYSEEIDNDIYGRLTKIEYKDGDKKMLYREDLYYDQPMINRMSGAKHSWKEGSSQSLVVSEEYKYDDLGRLVSYNTDDEKMAAGEYEYDIYGRLTKKTEDGSTISYQYKEGSYQPTSVFMNGSEVNKALQYDPSGRVWMDGVHKVSYKLNTYGMPEYVAQYSGNVPSSLTVDEVDASKLYSNQFGSIKMAYDETGTRIWTRYSVVNGIPRSMVTIPGVGVYKKEQLNRTTPNADFKLDRLDLVNGGFRNGPDGVAYFPVTDVQGNIRGYADKSSLRAHYAYYPFGQEVSSEIFSTVTDVDNRRWQSKEFDGEHGKYYFGARYFDPLFGLWMSPDPAHQFANPYTYGGDPLNLADPSGLFAVGLGLVFGWDEHGWKWGIGFAADFTYKDKGFGVNSSYTWSQDGSSSYNVGASGFIQFYDLNLHLAASFNYNTYTGTTLSAQGGVCVGVKDVACAGLDVGGGLYWDRQGNFLGATAFWEAYAEAAGGLARVSGGYEAGLLGMEGRGLFAGANIAGLHAGWSRNGGYSYGFEEQVYYKLKNDGPDPVTQKPRKYVGLSFPSLGIFSDEFLYDHGKRNDNQPNFKNRDEFEEFAKDPDNDMKFGPYPESQSKYHHGTKMWMAKTAPLHFLWFDLLFTIPAIEAVFDKNGNSVPGDASYNYGQNWASHLFLDIVPWKVMDEWFPNL